MKEESVLNISTGRCLSQSRLFVSTKHRTHQPTQTHRLERRVVHQAGERGLEVPQLRQELIDRLRLLRRGPFWNGGGLWGGIL